MDRSRHSSAAELKEHTLGRLREAIALLEEKATPEEVEDYRGFVIAVAERVGGAKDEGGADAIGDGEMAAIDEIAAALGRA